MIKGLFLFFFGFLGCGGSMAYEIDVDGVRITVEKKSIKHMYIRILPPNGDVKISAPHSISRERIISFARDKMDWICQKQEEVIAKSDEAKSRQLNYLNGETHYLWGKPYTLQLIEKNKDFKHVFTQDDTIYLPLDLKNTSFEAREKTMIEFYRAEIKKVIPEVLERSVAITGRAPNEWRVKNMKTRWGTCNTRAKRIWINLQLAKKSPECLDYVMIHELTHLYVSNHGKEFKNYMDKFYPNWREVRKLLKEQTYY